jgi:hypothetical protein
MRSSSDIASVAAGTVMNDGRRHPPAFEFLAHQRLSRAASPLPADCRQPSSRDR